MSRHTDCFMRRNTILLLGMLLVGSMLTVSVPSSAEVITIRTWYSGEARMELFEKFFAEFEKETGIQVVHENPTAYVGYVDRLILDIISGNVPDVIMTNNRTLASLVDQGLLVPLDDFVAEAGNLRGDVFENLWDSVTYKGRVWGLPYAGGPQRVTWLNKDMFDELGLEVGNHISASYDEFRQHALRLTRDRDGDGVPDVYGLEGFTADWFAFYWSSGADILNADRTAPVLNSPAAVAAIEFMVDLAHLGIHGGRWLGNTAAMSLKTGPWMIPAYRKQVDFELAMIFPPQNTGGAPRIPSSMDILTVSATSQNREAAWKLIEFMLEPERHAEWSVVTGFPPIRRSEVESEFFRSAIANEPLFGTIALINEAGVQIPVHTHIDPIMEALRSAIQEALTRQISVGGALENAQRIAMEYMAR